jgi:hypothetical protein
VIVLHTAPEAESQSLTIESLDADATNLPSGENAMAVTQCECSSVLRAVLVEGSQSLAVLS